MQYFHAIVNTFCAVDAAALVQLCNGESVTHKTGLTVAAENAQGRARTYTMVAGKLPEPVAAYIVAQAAPSAVITALTAEQYAELCAEWA